MIVVAALAVGAAIYAGLKFSQAVQANAESAAIVTRNQETALRILALETRLRTEVKNVQEVKVDNLLLVDALNKTKAAMVAKPATSGAPMTRQALDDRFKRAQALVRTGDPAEALRELLACDEGFRQLGGSTASLRISMLTSALAELARRSPEALEELQRRRDALRQKIMAGPGGADAVSEFSAVVKGLKQEQLLLEVYDALPPGDRRRSSLAIYGSDQLLAARRYADLAETKSYGMMSSSFEMNTTYDSTAATGQNSARLQQSMREMGIRTAGKDIEVLAGIGDLDHARVLLNRLLAFDSSEATKTSVRGHLERAGHPELLPARPKP
jgi:hypothetical protein